MKKALKQIEEALNQLEALKNAANGPSAGKSRTYSFEIGLKTAKNDADAQQQRNSWQQSPQAAPTPELPNLTANNSYPLPVEETNLESSFLPENPPAVTDEEAKFEQVISQIQDLYNEGPIVDGWLEYYPPAPEPNDGTLREVSFERVIEVEKVGSLRSAQETRVLPGASYRLCGLDESGQQWSYPCPLDQLPNVSMAIARYQKLQQLLQQKQEIENHLRK